MSPTNFDREIGFEDSLMQEMPDGTDTVLSSFKQTKDQVTAQLKEIQRNKTPPKESE